MTRKEVRDFLESGVNALTPAPWFGSGRLSEMNQPTAKGNTLPIVWQLIGDVSVDIPFPVAPIDSWNIELLIADKDAMDSQPEQYELIIDRCDEMAQRLVYKYRNIVEGFKLITMEGISREPFVKTNGAAIMSGVTLKFTLIAPDQTDVC